jgi:hypothetical protein
VITIIALRDLTADLSQTIDWSRSCCRLRCWLYRPVAVVNVPYLANIDPKLASATTAEREALLSSARSFMFATPEKLGALYKSAGVMPDRQIITYCVAETLLPVGF